MQPLHALLYLQEIQAQCRMVHHSHMALDQALASTEHMSTIEMGAQKTAEVFCNVHSMLIHTSNISRLLWPGAGMNDGRGQRAHELRLLIGLPEKGHALIKRTHRDHLEHFDERLDAWVKRSETSPEFWHDKIGPWGVPQQFGAPDKNVMRHFDPTDKKYRFHGQPWDVIEMTDAVRQLQRQVEGLVASLMAQLYPRPIGPFGNKIVEG